jgi:hypothetical protein
MTCKFPLPRQKQWDTVEENIKRVTLETIGKIIEQVYNFIYLGYLISNDDNDVSIKLKIYSKVSGMIKDTRCDSLIPGIAL